MAVRHGYTIVPIATVGTEDIVQPVYDVPIRDVLTAGGTHRRNGKVVNMLNSWTALSSGVLGTRRFTPSLALGILITR